METFNNLTNTNKNDILDPLSCIVKLFIYSYKLPGCKISIGSNHIYIQDNNYIQGLLRRIKGDTKNDISILTCPILYACIYYLKNEKLREQYIQLFQISLDGFSIMKQTYSGTSIIYNIEHLINIIQSFLENSESDIDENATIINPETPIFKIKENIYQHINGVWTESRKKILLGFIKDITETTNSVLKSCLIEGLSKFMDCIDIIVSNILINNAI